MAWHGGFEAFSKELTADRERTARESSQIERLWCGEAGRERRRSRED
jgi:hypothetical protein